MMKGVPRTDSPRLCVSKSVLAFVTTCVVRIIAVRGAEAEGLFCNVDGFFLELCCDTERHGLRGNELCWDRRFDYESCCDPLMAEWETALSPWLVRSIGDGRRFDQLESGLKKALSDDGDEWRSATAIWSAAQRLVVVLRAQRKFAEATHVLNNKMGAVANPGARDEGIAAAAGNDATEGDHGFYDEPRFRGREMPYFASHGKFHTGKTCVKIPV